MIEKTRTLYEILIRFAPDGSLQGAHRCEQEVITDGDEILNLTAAPAEPVDLKELAALFDDERIALLIAQVGLLKAENSRLAAGQNELAEMVAKLTAENRTLLEGLKNDD